MPSYDYKCIPCDLLWNDIVPYEKRMENVCPMCGQKAEYQFPAPMIMSASYPDGVRKFTDMKEAAKLNREAVDSKSKETKKEIAAEIKKMGVRVSK